ncbi:GFA family protein [Luteimonas sp BLCC-B24]|uniref:GFA family protein n=1 Tax=Luteimonas sp. BLCC-B24 TaxID=3025317 RepID=UPI00234C0CA8|nr:GFA family protein [Luteimonas sp. BLCC-B24]MDC7808068.1 GFA family protein [Luteimonas sp. BLCC-B24]
MTERIGMDGDAGRLRGRCLCGGVSLSVPADTRDVDVCHCGACRRWHGGPAMVLHAGGDLRIEAGDDRVRRYPSSAWAERAFCAVCGSGLFFRLTGDDQAFVPAGLFDAIPGARLHSEIFTDAQPGWYAFAGRRERLTEAEFLARVGTAG